MRNAGGLVSAILALAEKPETNGRFGQKIVWMGKTDDTPEELAQVQKQVNASELVPVRIEERLDDKYYGGFCNDMLWPLFHYFPRWPTSTRFTSTPIGRCTSCLSKRLATLVRPTDLVWVHDYHLMLLPALMRRGLPNANIGFFLHIPFPSFEILRLMPRGWRETLLRGILARTWSGFTPSTTPQYLPPGHQPDPGDRDHPELGGG